MNFNSNMKPNQMLFIMKKNLFFLLILSLTLGLTAACSSSSDDTDPPIDTTDDTSSDESDDSTDDTSDDTETVSYLKSMERQNPDGSLIRRVELNYNAANEIESRTITDETGDSSSVSVSYTDGKLTEMFGLDLATGEEVLILEFVYDSQGRLDRYLTYFSAGTSVGDISSFEYDSSNRVTQKLTFDTPADFENDDPFVILEFIYQGDNTTYFEESVFNALATDPILLGTTRVTELSTQPSSLFVGEGASEVPLNLLLLTLNREDFINHDNFLFETYSLDLDTNDLDLLTLDVDPVFDADGRLESAIVKYYSESTTELISDERYIFTYEER